MSIRIITGIIINFFIINIAIITIFNKTLKKNESSINNYKTEINELNMLVNKKKEEFLECEKIKADQIISIKSELKIIMDLIKEKIQTIPILNAQLNAVIEQTNNSINDLISDFFNIDKKMKEQNNNTKNILNKLGFRNSSNINILDKYKIFFNDVFGDITKTTGIIQNIFDEVVKIVKIFLKLLFYP